MERPKLIVKPNHIVPAKVSFTALQLNIIYIIIDELQKIMSKDINQIYQEQEIKIAFKELDINNNYNRVRKAFDGISKNPVTFQMSIPGTGKVKKTLTSLLSGLEYELQSTHITFIIPSRACIYFCYIGGGFTSFQKTIALSLKSLYSKIMYDFCCRWIDRGGYQCSIESFKEQLNISDKYNQISHLRNKVLEPSKKELKMKADVYFMYSLIKEGRKFSHISFKIFKNSSDSSNRFNGVRQEHYSFIYVFLSNYFVREVDNKAQFYTDIIVKKGKAIQAYERFKKLDDQFCKGIKTKKDIKNLLDYVILKEFGVVKK